MKTTPSRDIQLEATEHNSENDLFFNPQRRFKDYILSLKPTMVIEIGAGKCPIYRALKDSNICVVPIDIFPAQDLPVMHVDARKFVYPPGSLPIIARPCHGPWIRETIEKAVTEAGKCLYIGLKSNVHKDLDWVVDEGYQAHTEYADVTGDPTHVFVTITNPTGTKKKKKFVLFRDNVLKDLSWSQVSGNNLVNPNGGFRPFDERIEVVKTVEADCFEDLDFKETYLYRKNDFRSLHGWIDREGTFYGCDRQEHDAIAHYVFKTTVGNLESQGWVRYSCGYPPFCSRHLSEQQQSTLDKLALNA